MPLNETLNLDITAAQRQIDRLNAQLDQLSQPVNVPVNVTGGGSLDNITRELTQSEDAVEELNRELDQTDDALRTTGATAKRTGDDLESAGRKGKSSFDNLSGSVKGLFAAFGGAVVIREFAQFAIGAIDAASNLEESTSKATVVFGQFFDEIEAFSQTGPQALGLANAQALEFTATFGNLFVALGLSQQAAAELSPEIVQLGADLASFNNIDVTEALEKLRAGLVGEAEPLRVLGVNLTAAATAAKAVELGLADSTNEVSEAAKVQARYALILEQTTTAQGDFARTADGIANSQRTLGAEFENLRATIGEALLPAFDVLLEVTPALVDAIERGLVPAFAALGASAESIDTDAVIRSIAGLPTAFTTTTSVVGGAAQAFGNAIQVFGSFAELNFDQVGIQFAQLGEDINSFRGAPIANQAIQNLITTLISGKEPAAALESVLVELGNSVSGLTLEQFEDLAVQLVAMAEAAGATAPELKDLADQVLDFGREAGFSEAGIQALADMLLGPWARAMAEASVGDIIAANIAATGQAAEEAEPAVSDFTVTMARLGQINLEGTFTDLSFFDRLPDALGAAAAAMEDEEGKIITDFSSFVSDLQDELTARQIFSDNLAILEALGLDSLAAVFEEAGLESATALADAIANPEEAARAEALLDEQARLNAISYLDEFSSSIESGFNALGLQFEIPVFPILQPLNTANFALPQGIAALVGVEGSAPGGNTYNIVIESEQVPPPDIARVEQVVRAVSNPR